MSKVRNNWLLQLLDVVFLPFLYVADWGKKLVNYNVTKNISFFLRVNSSDKLAVMETWKCHVYDKFVIKPDFIIVDIGAHIGAFSIYSSKKANKGKVFSYEANIDNFEILKKNKILNSCNNLEIYNLAVAGKTGFIKFYNNKNGALSSMYSNGGKALRLPCTSMADIFISNKIKNVNLMKIDIEGGEYEVLFNTPVNIFKKIFRIEMEYHELMESNNKAEDLIVFLKNMGYKVVKHGSSIQRILFGTGYISAERIKI